MPDTSPHDPATAPHEPAHQPTWDLIPWVVNGRASATERATVARHVAACEDCRDELDFQREVHAQMALDDAAGPLANDGASTAARTEAAWLRMAARLDADRPPEAQPELPPALAYPTEAAPKQRWTRLLLAAVVVQSVGLAALLGVLSQRPPTAEYQTLGRVPAAAPEAAIRLVAEPDLTLGELQALLARSGVVIVESRANGAALGLALRPGTARDAALAQLRREPRVVLAEPVGAERP